MSLGLKIKHYRDVIVRRIDYVDQYVQGNRDCRRIVTCVAASKRLKRERHSVLLDAFSVFLSKPLYFMMKLAEHSQLGLWNER